jgi:predicted secreted protein
MSIAAQLAQNSKLYIAGTAAAAETLTAITVGYPTIIAITGHAGVANGDKVTFALFDGADAALINGLSFTVENYATGATNDTFAIDLNTVGKTITIGTATATPTAWIQVKEIKGIKPSGASATKIDVTDLDSTAKEYRTGLVDNGTFSADVHILETDAGQAAVLAAFYASSVNSYKVVTPAKTRTFSASCLKFPTVPDASVDGVQTGSAEFVISGTVTVS